MESFWIKLNTIKEPSKTFLVDDPNVWEIPISEFKMDYTIQKKLRGEVIISPQDSGCFITGTIEGCVKTSCDRCTAETELPIHHSFKTFEAFQYQEEDCDIENTCIIRKVNGQYEVNVANILWEEFVLSLPTIPICHERCKGLCFTCGKNLNTEQCTCANTKNDQRFALLKHVKIKTPPQAQDIQNFKEY